MKKLFVLILTVCFCGITTGMKASINVSYGIPCGQVDDGKVTGRTFIPPNLFAGIKIETKHIIEPKIQTAIADSTLLI